MRLAKKPTGNATAVAAATPKDGKKKNEKGGNNKQTSLKTASSPEEGKKKQQGEVISFEPGQEELDEKKVLLVTKTLLKSLAAKDEKEKKDLFDGDGQRVNLQVSGIKLPRDRKQQLLHVRLPRSPLPDPHEVCVIVKDLEKGIRPDHEPTVAHYKELLLGGDGCGEAAVTIMALRELKVEYKTFEAKTALCHKFDKFLIDERIIRLVPKLLGKPFYKRKRFPIQVNLKAGDIKAEIGRCMKTVILPLSHHGTCAMVEVGNTGMSPQDLVENVMAAAKVLAKRYPGGWKNIRSLHLKTEKSLAIPIHISTVSPNEIGYVDADAPKRILKKAVTDELSTQPGMVVTVMPLGGVKITKTKDAAWDDEKDEPFVEDSEEEGESDKEEEEDKKKEKDKGTKRKKGKAAEESKIKKKKKKQDSDEEEDEKIEKAELMYRQKIAEGEEVADESQDKAKPSEDEDEDDDEEEESDFDDDDADDVVVDMDDDDDEEDDEDEDDKLLLKRK